MFAQKVIAQSVCLKNKGILIAFLLFLFVPRGAWGDALGFFPEWVAGTSWRVKAIYQQMNGSWSAPVAWDFNVGEDTQYYRVNVTGVKNTSAELLFPKDQFYLERVIVTNIIKGKKHTRIRNITQFQPVSPRFSIIPFHCPLFVLPLEENGNLRAVSTKVIQEVSTVSAEDVYAALPDQARTVWTVSNLSQAQECFEVNVSKGEEFIFKQFWIPGFPWAIYTESKVSRAWLIREQ
jgi:hypothetical protein